MLYRVLDNPLLVKHMRSRLRPAPTLSSILIVIVVACMILWGGAAVGSVGRGLPLLLSMQGVILLLLGTSQVGASAGAARDSGILEFHRVSPVRPVDLALGFLLGAPIREYYMAAVVTPFALVAAAASEVGIGGYAILWGLLISSSLLFHSLALIGGLVGGKRGNVGIVFVILCHMFAPSTFGGIALPGALTLTPAFLELQNSTREFVGNFALRPRFFGQDVPMWIQSYAYQVPLFIMVFLCCVRRMSAADRPIYSKSQAALVLLAFGVLSMAAVVNSGAQWIAEAGPIVLSYVLWIAGMGMALAVTPTRGDWKNGIRRAMRLGQRRPHPLHDWAANSVCMIVYTVIVAGVLTFPFVVIVPSFSMQDARWMRTVAIASFTVLYFGWGLQYFYLRLGKVGPVLFALLLFFLWLVPLMLGGVLAVQGLSDTAAILRDMTPVVGIATGGAPGLVVTVTATLVFAFLLWQATSKGEQHLAREIAERESAALA